KAGGVFYTPKYIVDYIVERTVGRLLEGRTPAQADRLRILDPACGSGSFLIQAYQRLLDGYRDRYIESGPEKRAKGRKPVLYQALSGEWRLTTAERKRILLNSIFGVDIDPQAVEVTKLSLLLKVLEGESGETLMSQLKLFHERALPDLSVNIRCGNSLIGPDFYDGELPGLLCEEERYRINVFEWEREFPEVFAAGGFDTVIGNPPYIRIQTMKEWAPLEVEFYKTAFASAGKGNYDIYVAFVEKGLGLLNAKGRLGFILPHKFFNAQYGESLRNLLAKGKHLSEVVHFGDAQIFTGATTYTCLLFLDKAGSWSCRFTKVDDLEAWRQTGEGTEGAIPVTEITAAEWNFTVGRGADLFEKLRRMPVKLGDVADIFVGLQTSADDVFIMNIVEENENAIKLHSKSLSQDWTFEKSLLFPLVSGTDVQRYGELPDRQYILFPYEVSGTTVSLIEFRRLAECYPQTAAYLTANRKRLEGRERGKSRGSRWHGYIYLKNMARQGTRKICIPRLVNHLYAAYDAEGRHYLDNVDVGGVVWRSMYQDQGFPYLLGILNSKLSRWYFPFVSAPFRGGWLSANRQFLSQLPIRPINFADTADRERHDRMVALVEEMLALHRRLAAARTDHEQTNLKRQIDAADRRIDRLVYDLYGLSEEEIRIVEKD
ncbi:MAG: Eco57I restriction-modification methylase domain-containing protein, partial [Proteobacteria bacterium]|nr:Eco57I restriction-modification methylase domain-containing protein [Pseudomonadota bacterium]